jgi:hypothetical protein
MFIFEDFIAIVIGLWAGRTEGFVGLVVNAYAVAF